VSTATVSRALTLPHKVKPLTLSRVQQAVQTLGYVAHGAARALASRVPHHRRGDSDAQQRDFANTIHALQKTLDEPATCAAGVPRIRCHIEVRATRALIDAASTAWCCWARRIRRACSR